MDTELTSGNVSKTLLKFSIPIFFSMLVQTLYSTADMIIIGLFMGKDSISAVSIGGLIIYVMQVLISGLISGVSILIARYVGQNNQEKIHQTIGGAILFLSLTVVGMTAFMFASCKGLASLMNAPKESYDQTIIYVMICSGGLCFNVAFNLVAAVFRAVGDSKSPFWFAIYSCCFNIAGDFLLIACLHMGVAGAALATIAAQAFSAIIGFIVLARKTYMKNFSVKNISLSGNKDTIMQIIKLGLPLGLQDALIQFSFVLVQRVVNGLGIDYSASYGVGIKILGYILLVPISFMVTLSTFVSQNLGAKKPERAKKGLYAGIRISLMIGIIVYILVFFQGENLSRLFIVDQNVVRLTGQFLKGIAIDGVTLSFLYCLCGYFTGYGKSRFVMLQGIAGAFLIRVPLAYLFGAYHSLFLIGVATPVSSLMQMIICICYFKYLRDKNLLIDGMNKESGGEMENNQLFIKEKITEHIIRIIGVSGEIMYLIKGSKKSILVDCGVGIGHLRSYIKENIGMDVDSVILTHGHIDHIGGAGEFEHIYLNPLDFELAQVHYTREKQIAHLNMCGIDSRKFTPEDYCSFDTISFEEIKPGEKIDLGDITLSIMRGKGHTQGQITVLIPEERYFILGDACNNFVFLFLEESSSVVEYKSMLEELKNETEGKYDHVLVCHGLGYEEREIIKKVINVCEDIIERKTDDVPFTLFGQQGYIARKIKEGEQRVDGKRGNVVYNIVE